MSFFKSMSKHFIEFPSDADDDDEKDLAYDPKDKHFSPALPDKAKEPKRKRRRTAPKSPAASPTSSASPSASATKTKEAIMEEVLQSGVVNKIRKEFECCVCKDILFDTRQCGNAESLSSSSSSSSSPPKGHNICGICWVRMLPLASTRENNCPQCPLCKCRLKWTSNATLDNVIEIMYPAEIKIRKESSWTSLPYASLLKEIPRRLDPNFIVLVNIGEYSAFLNIIAEIAREAHESKNIVDAQLTDKLYAAIQPSPQGGRRHPQRYFHCSVSRMNTHRWPSNLSLSCFGFGMTNDCLIVRLLDHYWSIVEADRILQ